MAYEPIKRVEVENYGCIRQTELSLTPLHALIGPNDSGKSTVLRAIRTVAQLAASAFDLPRPFAPLIGEASRFRIGYADGLGYSFQASPQGNKESLTRSGSDIQNWGRYLDQRSQALSSSSPEATTLQARLTTATMVRFEPDFLRSPASLIPERAGIAFADERGRGLASVFDAIVNRDVAAFIRIQDETKQLFPTIDKIGLSNTDQSHKVLAVTLVDGTRINAEAFVRDSDGNAQRVRDIEEAIGAHEAASGSADVIGGAAVPVLEGWLLSLQGELGTENLSKAAAQRLFQQKNGFLKDTVRSVEITAEADIPRIPTNAVSLNAWLNTATRVFAARITT
jgi:hypothetical protein